MKRRLTLGLAVVAGALVAALVSPLSRAEAPGKNGRIAYMRQDSKDHWQIWVANSDLSGPKKLTSGDYDSGWAVWSPDGKRLAFDSSRTDHTPNDSHHVNDVFVMNADGSGVKKITNSKGLGENPAWSPNGSLIAFDYGKQERLTAIYVRPSGGGKMRRITSPRPPLNDYAPRFSPDGTHLVFTRERGTADDARAALFTVRLDGTGLRRLTPYSLRAGDADWSPDGKRIVFEAYPDPKAYGDIFVVGATGGEVTNVTRNPKGHAGSADPVWSPDGTKILFLDNRYVNGVGRTGLGTMDPDGSARTFISSENVEAHQPDWQSIPTAAQQAPALAPAATPLSTSSDATSPGKNGRIAYDVKDRSGRWQLWVANADLSGAKQLTHGRTDGGWPAWSPDGTQIAFDSERSDPTPNNSKHINDVFVMKADGSGVKKLTDSKGESGDPAWSPSGSLLALDADRGNRKGLRAIYVMHANGGKLRQVTRPTSPLSDYDPRFSPDGAQLVFLRARGTAESAPAALFTVRLDGSGLHRLTPYSLHVDQSDWSPDGKRIVFEAYPHGRGNGAFGDIFVIDAKGGKPLNLTRNPVGEAGSLDPVWSPDGQKLLFLDIRRVNGVGRYGLATINPDGSDRQFISAKNLEEHQPDWESIGAASARKLASAHPRVRNGPLTVFSIDNSGNGPARIMAVAGDKTTTLWHCRNNFFCGQPVSFAWAADGRKVAFTLDELGANSPYVGLHVVNVVSGQDTHIPGGAPRDPITDANRAAWEAYLSKMIHRIGCWPAANLAWSPDGSSIAYNCGSGIHVLKLHGSGYATVPTGSGTAFWPTWSQDGKRIAYSTRLKPSKRSQIYTVVLDGSHRRFIAKGGTAPAWSPDGRTIAYQTRCGIRLVTPSGRDVTPRAMANTCSTIGDSGPPVWSPDGTKLALETSDGVYVMNKDGSKQHLASDYGDATWYGALPGRPSWRPIR